jgi:hypothetical protein
MPTWLFPVPQRGRPIMHDDRRGNESQALLRRVIAASEPRETHGGTKGNVGRRKKSLRSREEQSGSRQGPAMVVGKYS